MRYIPIALSYDVDPLQLLQQGEAYGYGYHYGLFESHQAGSIAVIHARGPFYSARSYDRLREAVAEALGDQGVVGVLVCWDSPGGSALGLSDCADFLAAAAKPVWSHVAGQCESAAYYLASQTGRISASRTSQVGSIGARIVVQDTSKAAKDAGVEVISCDTGPHKSLGVPGVPVTDVQRQRLQELANEKASDFYQAVARGREIDLARVQELATGNSWHAPEAVTLGLIDTVSTLDEAIAELSAHVSSRTKPPMPTLSAQALGAQFHAVTPAKIKAAMAALEDVDLDDAAEEIEVTPEQLTAVAQALGLDDPDVLTAPPAGESPETVGASAPAQKLQAATGTLQLQGAKLESVDLNELVNKQVAEIRGHEKQIRAMCAGFNLSELAEQFIDAGLSVGEAREKLLERLGKEFKLSDSGERPEASGKPSDPDAAFKSEYREQQALYQAQGITEEEYVRTRRIDEGLELVQFFSVAD